MTEVAEDKEFEKALKITGKCLEKIFHRLAT